MHSYLMNYGENQPFLEAYVAYDSKHTLKRPGILIAPTAKGRDEFTQDKADYMASLGYVGFALDIYGQGQLAKNAEETHAFINNRDDLLQRLKAAYDTFKTIEFVDPKRIAIMGYSFGGLCALDLARSGIALSGALAFHAPLFASALEKQIIPAKVCVLQGYADPHYTPESLDLFAAEMTQAQCDWQLHLLGKAGADFSDPEASTYNKLANQRSDHLMRQFFEDIF